MSLLEKVQKLLKPGGRISEKIPNFEYRTSQEAMLENIFNTYCSGGISLIEAGTGTGKSLSYLIPAIIWAKEKGEKTLISTHTITLQEQILFKDIPLVKEALNIDIKAVLVKGMSNYLCLRRMQDALNEKPNFKDQIIEELEVIESWSENTADGSLTDLFFTPSKNTWEKVCSEYDTCNRKKCPYFNECHFFKARKEAKEAHILIVNHALLFSDLSFQIEDDSPDKPSILPPYEKIIIDEAHNIEDVASAFFASKTSFLQMIILLNKLHSEQGRLSILKSKLFFIFKKNIPPEIEKILNKLTLQLPSLGNDLQKIINITWSSFTGYFQRTFSQNEDNLEKKIRIIENNYLSAEWKEEVEKPALECIDICRNYLVSIEQLEKDIKTLKSEKVEVLVQSACLDMQAFANRLGESIKTIENFISPKTLNNRVRWVEINKKKDRQNTQITDARLDISDLLQNLLFKKYSSICLLSATLTTNRSFAFTKERLGIVEDKLEGISIKETIYSSPFDYKTQAALFIPNDMPKPNLPKFCESVCQKIKEAVSASRGGAFILFTSYSMLNQCHEKLASYFKKTNYRVFKQGDLPRKTILDKFRQTDFSVLFGTDSFWQGVDVAGDNLRCVIIVKLPFQVPTEPLVQARCEQLEKKGLNPFYEYSIPTAIVKFKQGFGRLIRSRSDRGCIVCLDNRLIKTAYGKFFLNSLPQCQVIVTQEDKLKEQMEDFYKKTYRLVNK